MRKIYFLALAGVIILAGCSSLPTGESYNEDNLVDILDIYSDVESNKGKSVKFYMSVISEHEEDGKLYIQGNTSENLSNESIIVDVTGALEKGEVEMFDYIYVEGVVHGTLSYENLLGTKMESPVISSNGIVEKASYIDAVSPTVNAIDVNETKSQHGLEVTLLKVEESPIETRAYFSIVNNGDSSASVYSGNVKLIVDGQQYSEYYNFEGEYPSLESDLQPGTSTEGLVSYEISNISEADSVKVLVTDIYTENWDLEFENLEYIIK